MNDPKRNAEDQLRIAKNVAHILKSGGKQADVDEYMRDVEGVGAKLSAPTMAARDATDALPRPTQPRQSFGQAMTGLAGLTNRGAMFGIDDEIGAVVGGLVSNPRNPMKSFDKLRQQINAPADRFKADHPVIGTGAEFAGALATGLGAGMPRPAAQGIKQRLVNATKDVALGAGTGAAYGAGTAEPGKRIDGGVSGAAWGGGIVGGVKAAGGLLTGLGITKLASNVMPRPANANSRAGRLFQRAGAMTNEDLADADILKLAGRARLSLSEVDSKAAGAHADDMLMDVIGQPAVDRAGAAVATPSRGGADIVRVLDERGQRAPKAVRGEAEKTLGVTRENTVETLEQMAESRSQQGETTFGALRAHYSQPVKIAELDAYIGRPSFDQAVKEAENILREMPSGLAAPLMEKVKVNGQTKLAVRPLTFAEAQTLKQAHDDVGKMAQAINPLESGGVGNTRRRLLKNTNKDFLEPIKRAFPGDEAAGVPSYEAAMAGHADKSKLMEAHELGRGFTKAKTDELKAIWPSLSEAEREFYRKGAIADIDDMVRGKTDGFNPVRDFRDDIMRDNLAVITKTPEDAAAFNAVIEGFNTRHTNAAQVVGNSKTAGRIAQREDALGGGEGANAISAAAGGMSGLRNYLLQRGLTGRMSGLGEAQVDALAPRLIARGPEAMQEVVRRVRQLQSRQSGDDAKRRAVLRSIGLTSADQSKP